MEKQGQGAIEYLLIIGAAIIVVAIVVIMLAGILGSTDTDTDQAQQAIKTLGCDLNAVGCACTTNADCQSSLGNFTCDTQSGRSVIDCNSDLVN